MEIEVGDVVYSEEPESGAKGLKKVTKVFINETDVLVKVYAGNEIINATPTHPFWVEGKGWVAAGELIQGDQVRLYSGQFLEISKVVPERLPETIKVYNFEVEDWHTYFVSENNVLVHNSCAVNLPAWKKIQIDMEHILSGHTVGGSRVSNAKTLFPARMNESEIEKAIREAYKNGKKVSSQDGSVLIRGTSGKLTIEMWVNLETKTIETAYPIFK